MKTISKMATSLLVVAGMLGVCAGAMPVLAQDETRVAPVSTPLADPDMNGIIKAFSLTESARPSREFIKNWRKPKKILVTLDNNTNRYDWLKKVLPADVELVGVTRGDQQGYLNALKEVDGVFGSCRKDTFANVGPNFHWLHNTGVGIDQCFTGGIIPAGLKTGAVAITNSSRLEGNSVGGHGIALMMALSRGVDVYAVQQHTKKFTTETYPRMWSLQGRLAVIAGFGGVGSQMAQLAHGLGMRVMVTNAAIPANVPDYIEKIGLPGELDNMVKDADVVLTALPLTKETAGMFNTALINKFKKGAMFINVTRGDEQVDADVVAALESGQLSSAGFDDISNDSPLYNARNVIITPHVAAQNVDSNLGRGGEVIWAVARENMRRFANGEKMLSVVDIEKGF